MMKAQMGRPIEAAYSLLHLLWIYKGLTTARAVELTGVDSKRLKLYWQNPKLFRRTQTELMAKEMGLKSEEMNLIIEQPHSEKARAIRDSIQPIKRPKSIEFRLYRRELK